jgi:acyl-[acyl-carrier-protein]-phospholipid O-acyltransferase/long-chain-fatty-acid--[acyl-carrier-protein] ligase
MQQSTFAAYRPTSIFEAFLQAISLHGRKRKMFEDIRLKSDTYHGILRGALALGRLVSRLAEENEMVGVLMPNATRTQP